MNFRLYLLSVVFFSIIFSCKKREELNDIELNNIGDTAFDDSYFKIDTSYILGHETPTIIGNISYDTTNIYLFSIKKFTYDGKPTKTYVEIDGKLNIINYLVTDLLRIELPHTGKSEHNFVMYYVSSTKGNQSKKSTFKIKLPH